MRETLAFPEQLPKPSEVLMDCLERETHTIIEPRCPRIRGALEAIPLPKH